MTEYKKLYRGLGWIFVEIRASDNIKQCKGLADIVHNVPAKISQGMPEEEILEDVLRRADKYGARGVVQKYFDAGGSK